MVKFVAALATLAFTGFAGALPQELVSFRTADGGVVYADLYGAGERGVVLAHGGRFTKESWAEQAPVLAEAGFRVVAIDFRGRGRSRGGSQEGSADDVHYDVLAAVRFLREQGASSVAVVGASFGGGAAAQAAVEAEPGEIDRLVLLAHSPIENPEDMQGTILFIIAREDPYFGGARRLVDFRDQYERAPAPKELVILEGSAHAQFIFETDQAGRLMDEILRFLSAPATSISCSPKDGIGRWWISCCSTTGPATFLSAGHSGIPSGRRATSP